MPLWLFRFDFFPPLPQTLVTLKKLLYSNNLTELQASQGKIAPWHAFLVTCNDGAQCV